MKNIYFVSFGIVIISLITTLQSCGSEEDKKEEKMSFCDCYKMQMDVQKNFTSEKAEEWKTKCTNVMNLGPKEFDKALSECK